jgi:hypothetical protein
MLTGYAANVPVEEGRSVAGEIRLSGQVVSRAAKVMSSKVLAADV